jgi:hypothetical protein
VSTTCANARPRPLPRNRLRAKLILLCASLLLCFMGGELFLRLFVPQSRVAFVVDDDLLWRNSPNQWFRLPPAPDHKRARIVSIDERGYRRTVPVPTTGRRRILVLGDSSMFGQGISDEETFSSQLQALVGDRYEVINTGVPGWGAFQMEMLLKRIIEPVRPEIVIAFYDDCDVLRQPFPPDQPQRKADFLRHSRFMFAVRHYSKLGSLVGHMIQWIVLGKTNRGVVNSKIDDSRGLVDGPTRVFRDCLEQDRARLAAMKALTDRAGAKFVLLAGGPHVCIIPREKMDANTRLFLDELNALCKEQGIIQPDLPAALAGHSVLELTQLPIDSHPSALWNRLTAAATSKALMAAGIGAAQKDQPSAMAR